MRIFLTGICCVGKTTVGAALGVSLRMPFFDADKEIEAFFQKPIARLQAETLTMYSLRAKAAVAVESLLARKESRHCVVALPPSGLMGAYWRVIKSAGAILVVLADDPKNILDRIVFYDADSHPVHRELSPDQQLRYLREIKNDITYFQRSYARAHLKVHIGGLAAPEAAASVKAAVENYRKRKAENPPTPGAPPLPLAESNFLSASADPLWHGLTEDHPVV